VLARDEIDGGGEAEGTSIAYRLYASSTGSDDNLRRQNSNSQTFAVQLLTSGF
jgi:hypothetical protein